MIVGAAVVELHVHDSGSLKAKRGVVRRVMGRVRSRFPVSVAEVGGQDTWQRAVIGIVSVGNDARKLRAVLERVVAFVESLGLAEVTNSDVEILRLPVGGVGDPDDEAEDDAFDDDEAGRDSGDDDGEERG